MDRRNVIIFTAVQLETRAVKRAVADLGMPVHTIGIRACRLPAELLSDTQVVIMAGLAGALDPALDVGDVVIDDRAGIVPASVALPRGTIHSADDIVATPADKAALHRRTCAVAVDMETDLIRRRFTIPVVNVRAISDTAGEVLDPSVVGFVDDVGRARPLTIATTLLRHPALVPYLNRLGKNSKLAAANLGRAVRKIVESLSQT